MYPYLRYAMNTHHTTKSSRYQARIAIFDESRAELLERAKQNADATIQGTLDIRTRLGFIRHQKTLAYEIHHAVDMIGAGTLYILPNGMFAMARTSDHTLIHRLHLRVVAPAKIPPIHVNSVRLDTL